MDEISKNRIGRLHPKLRSEALHLWQLAENVLTGSARPRVTFTLRTFAEQNKLYQQGRTAPGPIVTNAPAGSSFHNYGLALDFALLIDVNKNGTFSEASWNISKDFDADNVADWMEVVRIFKNAGWQWGGDWHSFKDFPHLEKTFGYSIGQLKNIHSKNQFDHENYLLL